MIVGVVWEGGEAESKQDVQARAPAGCCDCIMTKLRLVNAVEARRSIICLCVWGVGGLVQIQTEGSSWNKCVCVSSGGGGADEAAICSTRTQAPPRDLALQPARTHSRAQARQRPRPLWLKRIQQHLGSGS